jgi:hypothetical protein
VIGQPPLPAAPPQDSGRRIIKIVAIVVIAVVVLCGICGSCFFGLTLVAPLFSGTPTAIAPF